VLQRDKQTGSYQSCHAQREISEGFWTQLHCGIQIRMVAGFAEVIESEATLVAEA
jgi:hypothetical protein